LNSQNESDLKVFLARNTEKNSKKFYNQFIFYNQFVNNFLINNGQLKSFKGYFIFLF